MNWKGKTPPDLGLPWDEVDTLYDDAMARIKTGYEQGKSEERKKIGKR